MKIDGINSHNIISGYNKNKSILVSKTQEVKTNDTIEISALGKSLTNYSIQDLKIDKSEKINELKNKIENGTYNIDAKLTAKSIIDNIRGVKI